MVADVWAAEARGLRTEKSCDGMRFKSEEEENGRGKKKMPGGT
jgi:hypothetical protein